MFSEFLVVYICSKMLKREHLMICHNYYNLPVAGPCLQTPEWGLKTRQQISSSSQLQEVSRSQAVPPCWCLVAPQPGSSHLSGFFRAPAVSWSEPWLVLLTYGNKHFHHFLHIQDLQDQILHILGAKEKKQRNCEPKPFPHRLLIEQSKDTESPGQDMSRSLCDLFWRLY